MESHRRAGEQQPAYTVFGAQFRQLFTDAHTNKGMGTHEPTIDAQFTLENEQLDIRGETRRGLRPPNQPGCRPTALRGHRDPC